MSTLRAVLCITGIVLAGYWGVFQGADFFVEEDPVTLFTYAQGNAAGNGWRPDKALGTSFFFADPGMFHAWAPLALLSRPFPSGRAFYTASVLVLLVAAACSQYLLLRRVAPGVGAAAWLLAPLVAFGPVRHELLFQRHWISLSIAAPLLILLLHQYVERPRRLHFAWATLLFWFTWFFGSAAAFLQALILGGVFTAVQAWRADHRWRLVGQVASLYAVALAGMLCLGAWAFYSMFVEAQVSAFTRAPLPPDLTLVNGAEVAKTLTRWLHSGLFDIHVPGSVLSGVFEWTTSWTNVSPVFPCVLLLVLVRRSRDLWLVTFTWMLLALMASELLVASPAYSYLVGTIWPPGPPSQWEPVYYCLQLGVIACVLAELAHPERRVADAGDAAPARRTLAAVLGLGYAALTIFAIMALLAPDAGVAAVMWVFDRVAPAEAAGFSNAMLREAATFDLTQLIGTIRWSTLLFYGMTAAILLGWSRRPSLLSVSRGSGTGFAAMLLVAGLAMSWAIYPLNHRALVWDGAAAAALTPTDRVYAFFDPRYQSIEKTVAGFRREWVDGEFGRATYRVGYTNAPALNLSGTLSFWPIEQAAFVDRAFREQGAPLRAMRELTFGPFAPSPWLDMAAVSHFVSWRPLPEQLGYPLVYKAHRLYLYRNPAAWPYYYLADTVRAAESVADIGTPRRGTAYVAPQHVRPLDGAGESRITLASFSPGRLVFDFDGQRDEFLTIADGWHSFWRARADDAPIEIVRANGVFKGAWIPQGRHRVEFYFDTSSFLPGVYISSAAWAAMLGWLTWSALRSRRRRQAEYALAG